MKKLKSILLSVCMLGTVCSLTSCGDKWEIYTEEDEDEIVSVGNYSCKSIVSSDKKEDIRKDLEKKYKNAKLTVTEDSVKGLLKDDISLEKDDDCYFAEKVRAEELDSIFETDGHTVETYVEIFIDEGFMEYEMYAQYDNDEDTYCFAEVDFTSPDFEADKSDKSDKEVTAKETPTKDVDFLEFYDNLSSKYKETFTDSYYKFDDFFDVSESHFSFCQLTSEGMMNLTLNEADTYFEMSDEFATFMSENEQILTGSVVKKSDYNIFTLEKKE